MQERNSIQVEVPTESEYFFSKADAIWNTLRRYHNVIFFWEALVKSDPVFLSSKATGNSFAKFTAMFRSPLPWARRNNIPKERTGDVYVDCLAFENKKNAPGGFIIQNLKKGCLISGIAVIRSGHKPVKHENDEFRANWVYGDYLYINIKEIKIDREPEKRKDNPYKEKKFFSDNPRFRDQISADQYVTDDDLIFDI